MVEFINNLCRICLSGENELLEIDSEFIVDDKPFHLGTVLLQIGGIKMKKNSELPSTICSSCLEEAVTAYAFRQKCRNSDKILQNFLKQARRLPEDVDHLVLDDGGDDADVNTELTLVCVGNTDTKVNVKIEPGEHQETTGSDVTAVNVSDDVLWMSVEEYYTIYSDQENNSESSLSRYKCNMCYDVFSDEAELISHLRIKHSIAQYQCKLCLELFSTSVEVHIHMSEHKQTTTGVKQEIQWEPGSHHDDEDNTGKMLVCHICGKVYKERTCLLKHVHKHESGVLHYDNRKYVCDYCGKSFPSRYQIETHIWGTHHNVRRYQCQICDKRSKTKWALITHYRTHTNIRSFSCSICGMGLVDKRALIQHERLHNDERPYACDICGRRFVCTARRNAHKITAHTKPTKKCPNCPALFHLNSMVNTHIKKVHANNGNKRRKRVHPATTESCIGVGTKLIRVKEEDNTYILEY